MKRERKAAGVVLGLLLCALTLTLCATLQRVGYLAWLDADIASEAILARRQADTGSIVQMDWLYSTEIRMIGPTQLYTLGFMLGMDYETARIFGNTLTLALGMAACVLLCRRLRLSWGLSLATAAFIPVTAGNIYAYGTTVSGFYTHHWLLAMLAVWLWLGACREGGRQRLRIVIYALWCALLGFLSVRYVLCIVCPMVVSVGLDALTGRRTPRAMRALAVTAAGFACCVAGYAAAETILPRVFSSGVGAADSFRFAAMDGAQVLNAFAVVCADFLKLLGWRGGAALFSAAGMVNLCVAGMLVLGGVLLRRAFACLRADDAGATRERRMLLLAAGSAALINLFCFLFLEGTYLNRYLIPALLMMLPTAAISLAQEKDVWIKGSFALLLSAALLGSNALLLREARDASASAQENSAGMMQTVHFLMDEGYTHGYGTFWNVRVMQERTQGALTFTGVVPASAEDGALIPCTPEFIRWLEPSGASALDASKGKTFLVLTRAEEDELSQWLAFSGAPVIFENADYAVYGFDSSQALCTALLLGKATIEPGDEARIGPDGFEGVTLGAQGRLRIPPSYREAGSYALQFVCEGEPAAGSAALAYTGKAFSVLAEQAIREGENELTFTLNADDLYFMLQLRAGEADGLCLRDIRLERLR